MKSSGVRSDNLNTNNGHLLQQLVDEIMSRRLQPEDHFEIAAYLESVGWNDTRAAEVFGVRDVFELSFDIWDAIQKRITAVPYTPIQKNSVFAYMAEALRSFLRGLIFALPMAISVFSMLTLRFSLWSYEFLSTQDATSIAIGTIMSFVTVGGFTQAIARRGFFYITQGYYNMGRRITFYFIRVGFATCGIMAAAFAVINMLLSIFPFRMALMITVYFLFLSAIWLSVTVMYILKKELLFTGLLVFGIFTVLILFKVLGLPILVSQVIALFCIAFSGLLFVLYLFKKAESKMEKGINPLMPRMSITLYSIMPYFIYGFIYFSFLYTDRIVAWSTNDSIFMPFLIWFRGSYELALDFALLMLIIPMGLNEVVVNGIMFQLESSQKHYSGQDAQKLNDSFLSLYRKRLILVCIISCLCAAAVYAAVFFVEKNYGAILRIRLISGSTSHMVFIFALFSYAVIAVALMNAVILFSLSQPELVNSSILPALLVNVSVGFVLSRWGSMAGPEGYNFAVFGLASGAVVFLVLSCRQVVRVLKNLDYYIYALS